MQLPTTSSDMTRLEGLTSWDPKLLPITCSCQQSCNKNQMSEVYRRGSWQECESESSSTRTTLQGTSPLWQCQSGNANLNSSKINHGRLVWHPRTATSSARRPYHHCGPHTEAPESLTSLKKVSVCFMMAALIAEMQEGCGIKINMQGFSIIGAFYLRP